MNGLVPILYYRWRDGKIRAAKHQCEFYCALLCWSIHIIIPKMRAFNYLAKYSNVWNSNNHTFCKPRGTVEVIHISHLKYIYGITGALKVHKRY